MKLGPHEPKIKWLSMKFRQNDSALNIANSKQRKWAIGILYKNSDRKIMK